jgi:Ca-activated chloride channel family protein
MDSYRSFPAVFACALLLCGTANPQTKQPPPQETKQPPPPEAKPANQEEPTTRIRVSVNEVVVPVTVTDDKGRFVSNLVASDFRVLDEGKPQRIEFFSHAEKQPVVVGFLVDLSNSTRIHWTKYEEAIEELVLDLLPGDPRYAGYLIGYSSESELAVNTTSDPEKIVDRVRKMKPGGGAALFDAIYQACTTRSLIHGEPYEPRRVIIIIGDGHDSASKHTQEEVLELAQRNMVTIYGMSTTAFGFANEDRDVLEQLTTRTGGHVEYPLDDPYKDVSGYLSNPQDAGNYALTVGTGAYAAQISAGIVKSVSELLGEITTQYVLRFVPDIDQEAKPKVFRGIKVEVPSLPTVKIHARDGYYPNPVAGAAPAGGGQ